MGDDLVTELRRRALCIFIGADKTVADDISKHLHDAAEEITALRSRCEGLERAMKDALASHAAGFMLSGDVVEAMRRALRASTSEG